MSAQQDEFCNEISGRWDRLRELMSANDVDAVVLVPGTNLRYFSGLGVNTRERLLALVIHSEGTFLIHPALEEGRLASTAIYSLCDKTLGWREIEDPYRLTVSEIQGRKRVGLDPLLPFWQFDHFRGLMPEVDWISAGNLLEPLRMRKSDWELERMRRACEITAEGIALEMARLAGMEGAVDAEVEKRNLVDVFYKGGGCDGSALVQFDAVSADPHGQSGKIPGKPKVALIDSGANVEGYWADLTRTRCFDADLRNDFSEIYKVVWEAHEAAIAAVRPGVTAASIDKAARDIIEQAGYGEFFTHRVGHGLGLDIHEPPYMVAGNNLILEPGMTFTVEPGIYLPGKFGVRIEDNVVVTKSGVKVLSPQDHRSGITGIPFLS